MTIQAHIARPAETQSGRRTAVDHRKQYARRAKVGDLLVVALWTSGAAAAALFLASGGAAQFGSIAAVLTSLGILAGLIGTDFVLVMLVLAARIPIIDRAIGHDRAIATHRAMGKPALYLLLGHGGLLLLGYGLSAGLNPIAEIASMFSLPDLPIAFAALGLLMVVVVTSVIAVRRHFSYEAWHIVHLLSYAAVALALPHQLSTGGVLAEGTVQRVYWIGLYVIALGSVLVYRFAEPLVASLRHRITVSGVVEIAPGVTSIHFTGRNLRALGAAGGQFFIWRFWTGATWWHSHPISLSAVPTDAAARITVRDLGAGSARVSNVPVGTRVSLQGPYGIFTDAARAAPRLAIAAAGIGVTPARALLEHASFAPGEATVLLRASDVSETYLWDEIRTIARAKGARLYTMIGPRSRSGSTWLSDDDARRGVTLASVFDDFTNTDLFACGPGGWLDAIESDARAAGLPQHQLHSERFDW